ncbi:ceramide kinase [Aplysia californica]|uniref:Ceramide kinase n=1 Tax=Aplysia californica TaxID=6500 RepID=A0ABM0JNK3_APLCA|nr:ceramide kinase [Aplysia californica]
MMATAPEAKVLLYAVLEYENKPAHVYLTSTQLLIENSARPRSHDESLDARPSSGAPHHVIDLREVIAVRAEHRLRAKEKRFRFKSQQKPCLLQEDRLGGTNTFSLFMIKRVSRHRWRHKSSAFVCRDYGTCQIWIDKIQELLKNPEWNRPKRLLVFINPFGGKKKAPKIFDEKVRPLFELAGIYSEVIVTKRQYHARDVIEEYDLQTVDGLICVGGDGTFSELLNGLLDRVNAEAGVSQTFRHKPVSPSLRIGIIPAGSTDAIVYSLVGINDPVTSALQVILGDSIGMDVTALYKKEEFVKYTTTMSGYGYYGDLLKDSETLRWMGPRRYTWCGFKTFLANKAYEGEVSFLLASEDDSHPRDHSICYSGCEKCRRASEKTAALSPARDPQADGDVGATGDSAASSKRASYLLKDGWHRVRGRFSAINLVTISCRCELSPSGMSPSSHLGDGCTDLILIQDCSRLQYLRHLTRIPDLKADQFDFEFIQVYRVKEFSFQPVVEPEDEDEGEGEAREGCGRHKSGHRRLRSASSNSVWNCDGEVVEHPCLYVQVHCQLIKLFARGVEEPQKEDSSLCPTCCPSYDSDK